MRRLNRAQVRVVAMVAPREDRRMQVALAVGAGLATSIGLYLLAVLLG